MSDEDTQAVDPTASAEAPAADSQSEDQGTHNDSTDATGTDQDSQGDSQAGNASDGKSDQPASPGDTGKPEDQGSKPDAKPLSRRSAQFRIQQLANENKELRAKLDPKPTQNDWDDEDPASDDQKPDIGKLVNDAVQAALKPVITEHSKAADDSEISELFTGDKASERSKYEPKIRSLWNEPQYKDVSAADLYKIVSFDDAVSTAVARGIEDYKAAEKEAKESSASGSSANNRTGKTGEKTAWDLSEKEFEESVNKVMSTG